MHPMKNSELPCISVSPNVHGLAMWLEIITGPQPTSELKVMCPPQRHLSLCPAGLLETRLHTQQRLPALFSSAKNRVSGEAQLLAQTSPFHRRELCILPGLQKSSDSVRRELGAQQLLRGI